MNTSLTQLLLGAALLASQSNAKQSAEVISGLIGRNLQNIIGELEKKTSTNGGGSTTDNNTQPAETTKPEETQPAPETEGASIEPKVEESQQTEVEEGGTDPTTWYIVIGVIAVLLITAVIIVIVVKKNQAKATSRVQHVKLPDNSVKQSERETSNNNGVGKGASRDETDPNVEMPAHGLTDIDEKVAPAATPHDMEKTQENPIKKAQ